jgi:hypothetical protein
MVVDNKRGRVYVENGQIRIENVDFDRVGLRTVYGGNLLLVMDSDIAIDFVDWKLAYEILYDELSKHAIITDKPLQPRLK